MTAESKSTTLVPLDGSRLSEAALPYAMTLAMATGQRLLLLSVWETHRAQELSLPRETSQTLEQQGLKQYEGYLKGVAERIGQANITCGIEVRSGEPSDEILQAAEEFGVSMIVMSTHGRSRLDRWIRGSVADKVMRHITVPTVLVSPAAAKAHQSPTPIKHILVPLDGSSLSEAALAPALSIAQPADAWITLVRSVSWVVPAANLAQFPPVYTEELDRQMVTTASDYLHIVKDKLEYPKVQVAVLSGPPVDAIRRYAEESQPDLIVMASHSRAGLARWVLGSVTDRTIHGTVPVMVVHPETVPAATNEPAIKARRCHVCGRAVHYGDVGPDDTCLRCGYHLRTCGNCVFYDGVICLLRRSEAYELYPGSHCPEFIFRETPVIAAPRS